MADGKSIFRQIIDGEIPSHKVYEDDTVLAFLDIFPKSDGHTLVVPKGDYEYAWDMPDDVYSHVMLVAQRIAQKINELYQPNRVGLQIEGLEIDHAHVHVFQFEDHAQFVAAQDRSVEPNHEMLSRIAEQIRIDEPIG